METAHTMNRSQKIGFVIDDMRDENESQISVPMVTPEEESLKSTEYPCVYKYTLWFWL